MNPEPEWAMVTVLFADLRGFTSFSDRATAREAINHLNAFFATAVPLVSRHRGWPHKLLGDGLMAVFGAREPLPDHADRALAAARELVDAGLPPLGVGVNSGLVLVGPLGAGDLVEHGVVGDPVNVAARVQDATKALGTSLLVTAATRCLLEDDRGLEARGTVELRGKAARVAVYADAVTLTGRRGPTTRGA